MPFIPPIEWAARWTPEQLEWMERTYGRMDPATASLFREMVDLALATSRPAQNSLREKP